MDLVLTCNGTVSQNRLVGYHLRSGENLQEILASMREMVEGIRTVPAAARLASDLGVELAISDTGARILLGKIEPRDVLEALMRRDLKEESEL